MCAMLTSSSLYASLISVTGFFRTGRFSFMQVNGTQIYRLQKKTTGVKFTRVRCVSRVTEAGNTGLTHGLPISADSGLRRTKGQV